jgi:hypothetical protein
MQSHRPLLFWPKLPADGRKKYSAERPRPARFLEPLRSLIYGINNCNTLQGVFYRIVNSDTIFMPMDTAHYLTKFQKSIDLLDLQPFKQAGLELKAGEWVKSAVLKIQKSSWRSSVPGTKPFKNCIFFSIWVSDELLNQGKIAYNIHALKLRELKGYTIKSREFAEAFREKFKPFEGQWPNVSTAYGPLTLMEGWVKLDEKDMENAVAGLAVKFLEVHHIIDDLLLARKK